jgi:O-methyltransferase
VNAPPKLASPAGQRIFELSIGTWVSQALSVAAALGIADELRSGPRPIDEIATAAGADAHSLYRVLRALADVDVFQELDGHRFALTELGELLRSDVTGSMRSWAIMHGLPPWRDTWTDLLASVRTGQPVFERVHGQGPFEYLTAHPEYAQVFDAAMTAISSQWIPAVVAAYDFGQFERVVDVGGGNGALLAAVLAAHPELRGTLYDQAGAIAGAGPALEAAGVSDRCDRIAGDFFDSVPAGGDAYLLSNVIHDWDDQQSVQILGRCRDAMTGGGRVLLCEAALPDRIEPSFAKWIDLETMLIGGGQRTEAEFGELYRQAGLRLSRVVPSGHLMSILEAVPAGSPS